MEQEAQAEKQRHADELRTLRGIHTFFSQHLIKKILLLQLRHKLYK